MKTDAKRGSSSDVASNFDDDRDSQTATAKGDYQIKSVHMNLSSKALAKS